MILLNYDIQANDGSNEWVVFLHGAGGSIATWKHQIDAFKKHYNVLSIDLRDHGKSKDIVPAFERYNFDIVVADIKKVLDHLSIKGAHFVTLSFGSVLMQAIYERHPKAVQSMTLIGGIFNANWMIKAFVHSARLINVFLPYHLMYRIFSFLLMPKKNHQVARRVYQMQARKLKQNEYVKWLGLYSEFFVLLRSFHRQTIQTPTLILMGEEDYLFLPSARSFVLSHPGTHMQIISDAGHICNIEKPFKVNEAILSFLSTHTSSGKTPLTTAAIDTN